MKRRDQNGGGSALNSAAVGPDLPGSCEPVSDIVVVEKVCHSEVILRVREMAAEGA